MKLKMTLIAFLLLALIASYGAMAQEAEMPEIEQIAADIGSIDLEMIKEFYNDNIQSYKQVADLFANDRINIYVEGYGTVGVVTENSAIKEINSGETENPTVNIKTNMDTIQKIMSGEKSMVDVMKSGEITLEGVGFLNWLRIAIANFMFTAASVFGLV